MICKKNFYRHINQNERYVNKFIIQIALKIELYINRTTVGKILFNTVIAEFLK